MAGPARRSRAGGGREGVREAPPRIATPAGIRAITSESATKATAPAPSPATTRARVPLRGGIGGRHRGVAVLRRMARHRGVAARRRMARHRGVVVLRRVIARHPVIADRHRRTAAREHGAKATANATCAGTCAAAASATAAPALAPLSAATPRTARAMASGMALRRPATAGPKRRSASEMATMTDGARRTGGTARFEHRGDDPCVSSDRFRR